MVIRNTISGTEEVILDSARGEAQRELGKAARRGGRTARWTRRWGDRAAGLRDRAVAAVDRLRVGPAGVEDASLLQERHDRDAAEIDRSLAAGEARHRRASRGARVVAFLLPWIDALLFAYFIAGVSNADIVRPWTTPLASLVTLGFTLILVLTVASFTPLLGRRLRTFRGPDGDIAWGDLDGLLRALVVLWAALTLAIGATMFVRVEAEAALSGAETWTGIVVALLLALASMVLNAFVLAVAMTGSDLADDTRRRAALLARRERRATTLERRATRLDRRRTRAAARHDLREARAFGRAAERQAEGGRAVTLARMAVGTPADTPAPTTPALDRIELDTIRRLL